MREIPFAQADKMIRAELRNDDYWANLSNQFDFWGTDPVSKAYLDKNFNYELATLALTSKDYDRARFYLDREITELLL